MGKSQQHSHYLDNTGFDNQQAEYDLDYIEDYELQSKIEEELPDLQLEFETENSTGLAQFSKAKNLPNDWQDFEPDAWSNDMSASVSENLTGDLSGDLVDDLPGEWDSGWVD